MLLLEYYSLAFRDIHARFDAQLKASLLVRPKEEASKIFADHLSAVVGPISWDQLFQLLDPIETLIAKTLERRTVFFLATHIPPDCTNSTPGNG